MDRPLGVASTPRPSAIPRFSKLPLPRPASGFANHDAAITRSPVDAARPIEHHLQQSDGRQSLIATVRGRRSLLPPPPPTPTTAPGTVRRPPPPKTSRPLPPQTSFRQPLGAPLGPQQRQETRPERSQPCPTQKDSVEHVKLPRRWSDQENDIPGQHPGDEVVTPNKVSSLEFGSPAPSLSDRTVESLAHMPSVLVSARRRSSFFNPHTPMTPSRPPSALDIHPMPKLNYGMVPRPALSRQALLGSRPVDVPQFKTPQRPAIPRPSISSVKNPTHPARPPIRSSFSASASHPLVRPASAAARPANSLATLSSGRTSVARLTRPSSSLSVASKRAPPSSSSCQTSINSRSSVSTTRQASTSSASTKPERQVLPGSASTSAALRSQIAQARLSQREKSSKLSTKVTPDTQEHVDDDQGENTRRNDEFSVLHGRLDTARRDGRLNISSLGLQVIPDEVIHMYDSEAMEKSSIAWNETVDISRFIAADNQLEEISDVLFPDVSTEELAEVENHDAQGCLLAGVELLDLHGNMLQSLPLGLRRLELLTSLNLSRNKFENSVFDVLTQISGLRELRLADNELSRDLPESVGTLTNLTTLDLHGNKLVLLPAALRTLVHLHTLNLSDNRFSDLSMSSLVQLPCLAEIYASKNALTGSLFPSTIGSLPHLRVLDVSNNSIASLTFSAILSLPSLTHLDISRNRLFSFPDMTDWTSIVTLLAEDNQLVELPHGFVTLSGLKSADLRGNCLRKIDAHVGRMAGLERLSLEGNPLRERRWASVGWTTVKMEMVKRLEETEGDSGIGDMADDEMF